MRRAGARSDFWAFFSCLAAGAGAPAAFGGHFLVRGVREIALGGVGSCVCGGGKELGALAEKTRPCFGSSAENLYLWQGEGLGG